MATDAPQTEAPKIVSAAQAETMTPGEGLPPAGDARRDEMKRRLEELQRMQADFERDFEGEIGAVDPSKLRVENEIAQHFDPSTKMLEVTNADPDYVYLWEQADIHNRHGGLWVTSRKAMGWEVVEGSMKEARDKRAVDGTRRVGDVILMRIRRERYLALEEADRRRRIARSEGISLHVLEEAERKGVRVHDLEDSRTPEHILRFAHAQAAAGEAARRTMVSTMAQADRSKSRVLASSLADRRLESAIRSGTVPGLTPGR